MEYFKNEKDLVRAMRSIIYDKLAAEYASIAKLYIIVGKDNRRISNLARIDKHKDTIKVCERFVKMSDDELLEEFSECWGVL